MVDEGRSSVWTRARRGHNEILGFVQIRRTRPCGLELLGESHYVRVLDEGRSPVWTRARRGHNEMLRFVQEELVRVDQSDCVNHSTYVW